MVIDKFLGNSIISRIHKKNIKNIEELRKILSPTANYGQGDWIDISGMIYPQKTFTDAIVAIENNTFDSLKKINKAFDSIHQNYYDYEWNWAYELIQKTYNLDLEKMHKDQLIELVNKWIKAVVDLDHMLYQDAKKEFSLSTQVSFGIDGDQEERKDFLSVRGDFDSNATVQEIKKHIEIKTALGNSVIKEIEQIKA